MRRSIRTALAFANAAATASPVGAFCLWPFGMYEYGYGTPSSPASGGASVCVTRVSPADFIAGNIAEGSPSAALRGPLGDAFGPLPGLLAGTSNPQDWFETSPKTLYRNEANRLKNLGLQPRGRKG